MKFMRNEEGFTGLEAAIVLIAFVVVAAVFSYVMLGAGFFTSQKSQEVVHTGVDQASASMEVIGDVYGLNLTGAKPGNMTNIQFTVGLSPGGSPVDFKKVMVTYSTKDLAELDILTRVGDSGSPGSDAPAAGEWTVWRVYNNETDDNGWLLEAGEQFQINVSVPAKSAGIYLEANDKFTLELKPSIGTTLAIKRTVPPQIDLVGKLY